MDQEYIKKIAESFEQELEKIAQAGIKVNLPGKALPFVATAVLGAAAALSLREAARDAKLGKLQRLNEELQSGYVW